MHSIAHEGVQTNSDLRNQSLDLSQEGAEGLDEMSDCHQQCEQNASKCATMLTEQKWWSLTLPPPPLHRQALVSLGCSDHSDWNRTRQDRYQFRSQWLEQDKTRQVSVQITATGTGQDRTGISSDHSDWNRTRQDRYQFRSQPLEQGKTGQLSVQITVIGTGKDRTVFSSDHSNCNRTRQDRYQVRSQWLEKGQDRKVISSDHSHWNRARQDGYQFRSQPLEQGKTGRLSVQIIATGTGQDRTLISSDHSHWTRTRQDSYQSLSEYTHSHTSLTVLLTTQERSQWLQQGKTGQFSVQITVTATWQDRTAISSDHSDQSAHTVTPLVQYCSQHRKVIRVHTQSHLFNSTVHNTVTGTRQHRKVITQSAHTITPPLVTVTEMWQYLKVIKQNAHMLNFVYSTIHTTVTET